MSKTQIDSKISIKQLFDLQNRFLPAEYQRNHVYNNNEQQQVIRSIFRNCYIPPIVLAAIGEGQHEILDGKQKVHSIFSFLNGKVKIGYQDLEYFIQNQEDTSFSENDIQKKTYEFDSLPEKFQNWFMNEVMIRVTFLHGYSLGERIEMYISLNK